MEPLKIRDIISGYDSNKDIVKNVGFNIEKGVFNCILGPNGCGKTTLLKTILGLLLNKKGRVNYGKIDILGLKEPERAKYISYVPQAHSLPFPFTVEDVVLMGRTPYLNYLSVMDKEDVKVARQSMERVGISHLSKTPYTQLSGGQQQLVIIARAITQEAEFLIMDEPCSNLDYGNQYNVLNIIKGLSKDMKLGVLMVTHDPAHCFFVADKILLMKEGHIILEGNQEEVMTSRNLEEIYEFPIAVKSVDIENTEEMVCIPRRI